MERNVPKLRFKGFNDEWRETTFKNIFNNFEYGMNSAAIEFDGKNKYIRITDIDESSNKYSKDNMVSPDGILEDKFLVKENDILFARTGASVGKTYLYNIEDGKLYFAGFLIRGNVKKEHDSRFIFMETQTENYRKWVNIISMRSGQPGINSQEYSSYNLKVPSLEEQERIANFLTKVDKIIEKQEEKVKNLEKYKKGMMQKIFSQEIRFKYENGNEYPEWEEKRLGKIIVNKNKGGNALYCDYEANILLSNEYLEKKVSNITYVSNTIDVYENHILILWDGSQSGKVYTGVRGVLGSTFVSIELDKFNNNIFVYQYLNYKKNLIQEVWREGSGVPHVAKDFINNFKIFLPCLEEQVKISEVLNKIDLLQEKETNKLENLRQLKKGLLQQMFV